MRTLAEHSINECAGEGTLGGRVPPSRSASPWAQKQRGYPTFTACHIYIYCQPKRIQSYLESKPLAVSMS